MRREHRAHPFFFVAAVWLAGAAFAAGEVVLGGGLVMVALWLLLRA